MGKGGKFLLGLGAGAALGIVDVVIVDYNLVRLDWHSFEF